MSAQISLMWISHLGPTLQLVTQAWLETSPATVTASVTLPKTPRWPWMICSLSTPLAHCCKGFPPTLSAHHRRIHTDRFSASPSSNRKTYNYMKQKRQKDFTPFRSSSERLSLHHNHASCDHIASLISQPRITAPSSPIPPPKPHCLHSKIKEI